jgi:DNA-binding transcriptional ArsR family regulator
VDAGREELVRGAMRALGDETKFQLVKALLDEGPRSAGDLCARLSKARSTIDEHLEALLEVGLVTRRRTDKKFVYEATELARLCIEFLEGRGSMERVVEALPQRAEVKVKVVGGTRLERLKRLASSPPLTALLATSAALTLRLVGLPLHIGWIMAGLGLIYGVARVRGALRVGRREVASACIVASLLTALASSLVVEGPLALEAFTVGFLFYLALFLVLAFTPFEAVSYLASRRRR